MWSFPGLLYIFYLSAIPAAWVVRILSPWFSLHTNPPVHVLITVTTIPEIDNQVYLAYIIIFGLLFAVHLTVFPLFARFFRPFNVFVLGSASVMTLYALISPVRNVLTFDLINPQYLTVSVIIVVLLRNISVLSPGVLSLLFSLGILKYSLKPMLTYDVGPNHYVSLFDYMYFVLGIIVIGYVFLVFRHILQPLRGIDAVKTRFTKKHLAIALIGSCCITILYLMTKGSNPGDIFFTLMPAYQMTRGGVPFVSMMSQYGIGYLMPWVFWLRLFPGAPVTFHMGVVITAVLLIGYFSVFIYVSERLYARRSVFVGVVLSCFYFSLLMRYYGFPDPVSLVSTPAFTPLRFGIFIFPLWLLLRYVREGRERYFRYFLVCTAACLLYSFETGAGIVLAGISVIVIRAAFRTRSFLFRDMLTIAVSLGVLIAGICIYTYVSAGRLPDFGQYVFFSALYGQGFLMLPLSGQTVSFLPIGIAMSGCIYGVWLLQVKKDSRGYLYWYLSCISLAEMPYYMGRSILPTIYNISLPFILTCGLFVEDSFGILMKHRNAWISWAVCIICGYILAIGSARGSVILGNNVLHSAEIAENSARYIYRAFTIWDRKNTPQFRFLEAHLPAGCPLAAMNDVYDLAPALNVPPAFNYPFMYGILVSKEQVDRLVAHRNASRICVFVDQSYIDTHDELSYGIYRYFVQKYGSSATQIARDNRLQYTLYSIPAEVFVAN